MTMILAIVLLAHCVHSTCTDSDNDKSLFAHPTHMNFPVYWNVPSFMCAKYGINFAEHTARYGIIANDNDSFRGSKINILYDPGAFPAVLKSSSGRMVERNGGIPQLGNVTYHLEALTYVINQLIPKNYSGAGIIDFEAWRPIFRQNFGDQTIYTNMSKELVQQKHPQYNSKKVDSEAARQFERASKVFLESSLKLVKQLRPDGRWGYYGYPYCYNYVKNTGMKSGCSQQVQKENNQIQWLFDSSDSLYPSLYMGKNPPVEPKGYVTGRMNEAVRVARKVSPDPLPEINPYMWYKYFDSLNFLSEDDLYITMETVRKYKAGGFILWGSSNDFLTKEKCQSVLSYLNRVIGPTLQRVHTNARKSLANEVDFVSVNNDKLTLGSSGSANSHYDVYDDVAKSTVENGQTKSDPQVYAVPSVVIYSAIGENGTANTLYRYEGDNLSSAKKTPSFVTLPPGATTKPTNTTAREIRSPGKDVTDLPLLREYMKGFESVLNAIAKRWSKSFKRKR